MSNNPYDAPQVNLALAPRSVRRQVVLRWVVRLTLALVVILFVIALLLPVTRSARGPAHRAGCMNNLRQIVLALQSYAHEHGTLPPAYTIDADGNRLHSWRTLILPYIEEGALYERIDLTKPWDHPANAEARETAVSIYQCPAAVVQDDRFTTYQVVLAAEGLFTGSEPRRLSDCTDDASQTLCLLEVDPERAVHWMAPQDTDLAAFLNIHRETVLNHPSTITVAFLDGRATAISVESKTRTRRSLVSIEDGD